MDMIILTLYFLPRAPRSLLVPYPPPLPSYSKVSTPFFRVHSTLPHIKYKLPPPPKSIQLFIHSFQPTPIISSPLLTATTAPPHPANPRMCRKIKSVYFSRLLSRQADKQISSE